MKPLVKLGPLRILASPDRSSVTIRRRGSLGRNGVCPFCHYIGPPLLCGCVTRLYNTLVDAESRIEADRVGDNEALVDIANEIGRHVERIRILSQELQREREG